MAEIARFNDIPIPWIFNVERTRQIQADKRRTVGGRMLMQVISIKRIWELQTRPITLVERNDLIGHLFATNFRSGDFWIEEFGPPTVTIKAFLTVIGDNRSIQLPDRRSLNLLVTEQ